jgi:hypothetical protein
MKISYFKLIILMLFSFLVPFFFSTNELQKMTTPIALSAVGVAQEDTEKSLPGTYGYGDEGRCMEVLCRGVPCVHCTSNGECCYDKCAVTSGCQETALWCAPGNQFCDYP